MEFLKNPYEKHLFVCVHQRPEGESSCSQAGEEICEFLKSYVKTHGLKRKVRISRSGCFDLCAQGPNILIFPDYIWYKKVTIKDLEEIIREHLLPLQDIQPPI